MFCKCFVGKENKKIENEGNVKGANYTNLDQYEDIEDSNKMKAANAEFLPVTVF